RRTTDQSVFVMLRCASSRCVMRRSPGSPTRDIRGRRQHSIPARAAKKNRRAALQRPGRPYERVEGRARGPGMGARLDSGTNTPCLRPSRGNDMLRLLTGSALLLGLALVGPVSTTDAQSRGSAFHGRTPVAYRYGGYHRPYHYGSYHRPYYYGGSSYGYGSYGYGSSYSDASYGYGSYGYSYYRRPYYRSYYGGYYGRGHYGYGHYRGGYGRRR